MIIDKGKFKLIYESENKSKTNYSLFNKINKGHIKTPSKGQQHLLKTYIGLSPSNNSVKKKPLFKKYNNSTLNQGKNINNKKYFNNNKLKYNRSFEGELIKNELLDNNNDKKNKNNNLVNKKENKSNSKINKTNILYSGNKSKTNNQINNKTNDGVIKILDEKFKSLENNIIDKKYENDIDHDEMIITTNNKTDDISKSNKSNESKTHNNNLNNIINTNYNYNIDVIFMNSSYENNKNDFKIMYVENYSNNVADDMLLLELKLIYEKTVELQKSYHEEINNILYNYFINKKEYNNIVKKYDNIQKKIIVLNKIIEKKNRIESQNCFDIYNKRNFENINDINKKEFEIWKIMMNSEENEKAIKEKREKLKEIFRKNVFEKYNKIKCFNDIEKKIILNLMKKNEYVLQNENEIKIKNNKSNNSLKKYNNKKVLSPITQNKNISYLSNTKFKHKKVASYYKK